MQRSEAMAATNSHARTVEPGCEEVARDSAAAPRHIVVLDTTLRDGEQTAGVCFTREDKLAIAAALASIGVDVIEAGFPGASPAEQENVRAVAEVVRGATICALARALARDIDAAGDALAAAPRRRIHVSHSSEVQLAHQLRRDRRTVVAMASEMVARARRFTDDIEFSPMDATRADHAFVAEIVRAALDAGATTINLPDTVGCALPHQVATCVRELRARVPEVERAVISFHGQDDLGLATANALAAIEAGAGQVELAVNGIGERAGNTSFEEVVVALRSHGRTLGVRTGVETRGIYALSCLVEARSGVAVPRNKAVVGANAFRHASGIHQDGVLKHRETYESLDPAWIGHPVGTEIVLGKLSGRAGFAARARMIGIELAGKTLDRAFERFQRYDAAREVDDDALRVICAGRIA